MLLENESDLIKKIFRLNLNSLSFELYYFGSRAKNSERPNSDLDLLLKTEKPLPGHVLVSLMSDLDESNLPFRVDLSSYSDLDDKFLDRIKNDLIRII